ncbi:amino acid lyase [Comamonas thiooxydans]|uniref:Amino acid lyase n=1 Tax=Comamonas thiooxydans TaxID=363952 RepID=A0A0E3BVG8_9BURK|nr:aminotransferase class I/II-fold pyridoxal phosphate-dependent enzyme [Comamonas thiooxydans]KGG83717.1 amino acid lyase [Comamonas thiooxydans]
MTTFSFLDDYSEGTHPAIVRALIDSNLEQHQAYGDDAFSAEAARSIQACLGSASDADIYFVASGTMANIVSISSCLRPHEAVIAASSGHIVAREAGAIEATGHKLIVAPAVDGKLTPAAIEEALANNSHFPHMAKPRLVYLSNATETGTVYTLNELRAISTLARKHDLILFLDGARLGVALAAAKSDVTLEDIATLVDIFWIGGTKAGALIGEAIVVCNPVLKKDFAFHIKQRGGMLAKGRLLGIQFKELFGDEQLIFSLARHANAMAAKLASGIKERGYEFAAETETNQLFPVLPNSVIAKLQQDFSFYIWQKVAHEQSVVRLVTSWATDEHQVDAFLEKLVIAR